MAKIPKKAAANIIFGNKERKQFPEPEGLERAKPSSAIEGPTQPLGFGYRLRSKFSEQVSEIDLEKKHKEDMLQKGMRQTFASRSNKRPKHLQHPAPVRGGQYRSTPQMERPHYEETEKMTEKTFNQFMTEAKKAGRPKKLKPGEEADTLHLQDQLSKLTHPNHVEVHFKDNTKHDIPRVHANKALHHLASLKPIERADHADHMGKSHSNFYHVLSKKSIPTKSKGISLAGPKLRKEEVELDEAALPVFPKAPGTVKGVMDLGDKERSKRAKMHDRESARLEKIYDQHYKKGSHGSSVAQKSLSMSTRHSDLADRYRNPEDHFENLRRRRQEFSGSGITVHEEVENFDEATRDKLQRYVQAAKPERRDPVKGEKRRAGVKLALKKIVGSDELGRKPKVKATNEEIEQIDEISQKLKDKYVARSSSQETMAGHMMRHTDSDSEAHQKAAKIRLKRRKGLGLALKREEIEYTSEEIELYDSLSEEHKAIFEKMDREELNKLMKSYKGKITKGKYNQPRESEKPWPASKMKGSKWASTAGSIMRKNQGYKK